jgi:hypothetical protein
MAARRGAPLRAAPRAALRYCRLYSDYIQIQSSPLPVIGANPPILFRRGKMAGTVMVMVVMVIGAKPQSTDTAARYCRL